MGGGAVPSWPGWRIHPCGRDAKRTVRNLGDREPGEPRSNNQRWDRGYAPTVGRNVPFAAMRGTQRLVRRGQLGVTAVAVVVAGVRVGRNCGGSAREIQTTAMTGQRELGPEQRRHREEGGALQPVPVATTDHDLSLPHVRPDATDPDQSPGQIV